MNPDTAVQRLHASSLLFRFGRWARNLIVPAILVLLFARGERWQLWFMVLLGPALVFEVIRYLTLRYRFARDEIVVHEGVLFRNERHIPFDRIQNIDLVQNPFHRMLGVAEVRLETAGGSEPEAVLRVLSLAAVNDMRRHVFAGRGTGAGDGEENTRAEPDTHAEPSTHAEPEGERLLHLGTQELVKLGLISNRGLALVAIGFGLAWEFDLWEHADWLTRARPAVESLPRVAFVLLVAAAVVVVPMLLMLFSVIWTIVRFHGFTLTRHGDDIRLSCGLLTRRSATIPRHRVQFVSIRETPVHRLFKCCSIRVETAGGGGENGNEEQMLSRKWFAPMVPRDSAPALLAEIDPAFQAVREATWQPLAAKAARRMVKKTLLVILLVGLATLAIVRPWGPAILLVLVPLGVWHALAAARYLSYAPLPGGLAFRSGVLTRKVSVTLFGKIQVASLVESPFDRRYAMASLRVDTAGAGPAAHRIRIPYLDRSTASGLLSDLSARAERTGFRW